MDSHEDIDPAFIPVGMVEPRASLLACPPAEQLLFKVMTVENFIRSIEGEYLHFNRADRYSDFPLADAHDGDQPPGDRATNALSKFVLEPDFSAEDYYARCRRRTYACCFSLENSAHIWEHYGTDGARGKVGLVFNFGKLRARVNRTTGVSDALRIAGERCRQIFSVDYGTVTYARWVEQRLNESRLPNPIQYTYLKDEQFRSERELRIVLSALGAGEFATRQHGVLTFPPDIQFAFDFRQAAIDGGLVECKYSKDCDVEFLHAELRRFRFLPLEREDAG